MAAIVRPVYAFVLASLLLAGPAWSANYYVSDEHEFTFRAAPAHTAKIIQMLPTGTPLEVLEDGEEWIRVRLQDGREGWVVKRFTMEATPKAVVLNGLRQRYAQLQDASAKAQEQVKVLGAENKELKASLDAANAELARVSREYETLLAESTEVIELKQQYAAAAVNLTAVSEFVANLTAENAFFRTAESLKWFLAGVAAATVPWFLGYLIGRFGGKRKQRISF